MFNRYRPKFEYRENNWTSNVFRVLELIFGRRFGIRLESSGHTSVDKCGHRTEYVIAYSTEAKIAFFEQYIRRYLSSLVKKIKQTRIPDLNIFDVFTPGYALAGISYIPKTATRPSGYMFAIALDTSASGSVGAGTTTVTLTSYTVTGSNTIMFGAANDQANSGAGWATNVTGVTANAVSMTKIGVNFVDAGPYGNNSSLWGQLSPASGNVVATRSNAGDGFMLGVETLSGASQSTAISSLPTNGISNGTFSTPQASPAVTAPSNGWVAMSTYISIGAPAATAGSGTTLRQTVAGAEYGYLFDSGSTVSGSTTLNVARTTTAKYAMVLAAVGPFGAVTANGAGFLLMM